MVANALASHRRQTISIHNASCSILLGLLYSISYTGSRSSEIRFNTIRPRQKGRHFPNDIFKFIYFNQNRCISIKTSLNSLKIIGMCLIDNKAGLFQVMAWRPTGDKPLTETMMANVTTSGHNELNVNCLERCPTTKFGSDRVIFYWHFTEICC